MINPNVIFILVSIFLIIYTGASETCGGPEITSLKPFHLAIPVNDLKTSVDFYGNTLGCSKGRTSERWQDFSLFGHQLVLHLVEEYHGKSFRNNVDGDAVPVPHFGVVLSMTQFDQFAKRLEENKVTFEIKPHTRFVGEVGEQKTMFFYDPSGNALEFKAFEDESQLFAT